MKSKLGLCVLIIGLVASIALGGHQFATTWLEPLFGFQAEIPENVLYESIFRLEKRNQVNKRKQVRDGTPEDDPKSLFKKRFDLTDEEDKALRQIAEEFNQNVQPIDARAREITDALRQQYQNGKATEQSELPPPPAELAELQERRNAIVLEHRDKLKASVGTEGFGSIDEKVKSEFAENFRNVSDSTRARRQQ